MQGHLRSVWARQNHLQTVARANSSGHCVHLHARCWWTWNRRAGIGRRYGVVDSFRALGIITRYSADDSERCTRFGDHLARRLRAVVGCLVHSQQRRRAPRCDVDMTPASCASLTPSYAPSTCAAAWRRAQQQSSSGRRRAASRWDRPPRQPFCELGSNGHGRRSGAKGESQGTPRVGPGAKNRTTKISLRSSPLLGTHCARSALRNFDPLSRARLFANFD